VRFVVLSIWTILIAGVAFVICGLAAFLVTQALHIAAPGSVSGIGSLGFGVLGGIFYGLIVGTLSAVFAGVGHFDISETVPAE
jgi:hypothetical protein